MTTTLSQKDMTGLSLHGMGIGLPDGLRTSFAQELRTFEEERQMTYITSIEEIGIEKGRIAGLIEGIAVMLDLKFGDAAQSVIAEIQSITDLDTLERLIRHIKPAQTLDEIRHIYAPTTNGN